MTLEKSPRADGSMPVVYLNGEFLPIDRARVPVLDRGFLFGDGVYEVIPAYGRRLFRLEEHLGRLQRSLAAIHMENPLGDNRWREILDRLVNHNPGSDQSVYVQVTRGYQDRRDHRFPDPVRPTVLAMSNAIEPVAPHLLETGIAAITVEDPRWKHCDIKAIALLPNVLLQHQARLAGAYETILVRDGNATEGSSSNLFLVRSGELVTPPKGPFLLPGITRDLVLELANSHGIPAREAPIPEADLTRADELWISSSTREILPVTQLNGSAVREGHPGPVWKRMLGLYQAYKQSQRDAADRAEGL